MTKRCISHGTAAKNQDILTIELDGNNISVVDDDDAYNDKYERIFIKDDIHN